MSAQFTFLSQLILRTPYYSFKHFDVHQLQEVLNDTDFRKAIYLASPSFYEILEKEEFQKERLSDKAKLSLLKYYNRMCFRPTPFGMFAAFGVTEWGNDDELTTISKVKLHVAFDQQINLALAKKLTPLISDEILFANPTLHLVNKQFRYVKTNRKSGRNFDFHLDAIAANSIVRYIIRKAKSPGINCQLLIQQISELANCSIEEAKDYILFLKDENILFSSLDANILGETYLKRLLHLSEIKDSETGKTVTTLIDNHSECKISELKKGFENASRLLNTEELDELKTPYYANLEREFKGSLNSKYQEKIQSALAALQKLTHPNNPPDLENFAQAFLKSYEKQKVPLLNVLDPEIGLGYGGNEQMRSSYLMEDLSFASPGNETDKLIWDNTRKLLLNKWLFKKDSKDGITLTLCKEDLERLSELHDFKLPPSIFVMFRIWNEQVFMENAGSVSATSISGRFTPFNEQIWNHCKEIAAMEQKTNPEVIFADLVQLTAFHTDNINLRKTIYDYEIPINGISTAPTDQQIALADLVVSVKGNEVILESKVLKKRIIPRLSTAFNSGTNDLSIFKFLFDLQRQNIQKSLTFNLEHYLPGLKFYPRLEFESTILCLAKWHLDENEILDLTHKKLALKDFQNTYHIPNQFAITHYDHQLIFDLDQEEEVALFFECLKGLKSVILEEYPFRQSKQYMVRDDNDKPLMGQFIASLVNNDNVYAASSYQSSNNKLKRNFMPGDEWIYFKVYIEPSSANHLLAQKILPFIKKLKKSHQEMVWFFIRYQDPDHHFRIRIKIAGLQSQNLIDEFQKLLKDFEQPGFIKSLQIDTYQRELERYQSYGIDDVEKVFHKSSEVISQFLTKEIQSPERYKDYQFALFTSDAIISAFHLNPLSKLNFLEMMAKSFYQEFSKDKSLKIELDKKYRDLRTEINDVLENKNYLKERKLEKYFSALMHQISLLKRNNLSISQTKMQSLLADLIHMHLNRLFNDQQRQQELVIYHLLFKHQNSIYSRLKQA